LFEVSDEQFALAASHVLLGNNHWLQPRKQLSLYIKVCDASTRCSQEHQKT
jgi:hypothetical protein